MAAATTGPAPSTPQARPEPVLPEPPPDAEPTVDPGMVGVPAFVIGSIVLGLTLIGYVPAESSGASLPIVLATTGLGELFAAIWAARLGQAAVASIFAIFTGFWWSYALLLLGLAHGWYGIATDDVQRTVAAFLITWVATVALLTFVTLRLPLAFTVLFVMIDVALALVLVSTLTGNAVWGQVGGAMVFAFATLGVYLWAGAASLATGGRALPLGTPVLR